MNLFIFKYNNYYNRILKKEETLEAYGTPVYVYEPQSFNPNDGINTSVLIGDSFNPYDGTGDYLILEEDEEILSHWFIIETAFETARAQWKLTLRRDLLVDFYDHYINTDCFIEKATLNAEDPLLFNSEDMTFNQIKTSEVVLKDYTQCPWIVGYYAKNTPAENLEGEVPINPLDDVYDILIDTTFANWKYNATETPIKTSIDSIHYRVYGMHTTTAVGFQQQNGFVAFNINGDFVEEKYVSGLNASLDFNFNYKQCVNEMQPYFKAQKDTLLNQAKTYLPQVLTSGELEEFLDLKNVIVKDIEGKYYQVNIIPQENVYSTAQVNAGNLFNSLANIVNNSATITGEPNTNSFEIVGGFKTYSMTATELTNLATTWDMTATKLTTTDVPYNIFAIPYGICTLYEGVTKIVKSSKEYALPVAQSIINKMGNNLYDIQLLPYCPIDTIRYQIVDTKTPEAYSLVKDKDNNPVTFILNVSKSQFTRNINYTILEPQSAIDKKISDQCDKYRLCSPNFNGYFDFSVAKNGGVQYFNVDMTLKPYQPYIHINPKFNDLYGRDFNDPRGLICGGDFSLTQFANKWQDYQIQNKNYQEMFDRQIQNMEIQNKYQKVSELLQAGIGTVQGAAAGTVIGGPGIGGVAGGLIGGVASLIGGFGDVTINEQLRTEAMDYTKDMFDYQLGNIQALPYTLTKVSSFNNNNKIFPLLERYTCTDREKDAFAKKLAYNGMTTMVIDKPSKYIGNSWSRELSDGELLESKGYIKGQIIRIETLEDEFHLLKSISDEFYKGVYIK